MEALVHTPNEMQHGAPPGRYTHPQIIDRRSAQNRYLSVHNINATTACTGSLIGVNSLFSTAGDYGRQNSEPMNMRRHESGTVRTQAPFNSLLSGPQTIDTRESVTSPHGSGGYKDSLREGPTDEEESIISPQKVFLHGFS